MARAQLTRPRGRTARSALLIASSALACALAFESWQLARAEQVNRQLAARLTDAMTSAPISAPVSAPIADDPRVWIAASRQPARRGAIAEAAALLRRAADASTDALADAQRGELRATAWYDLGNLYLREALRLRQSGADASALPLLELSKDSYRNALLERPDLWDAKFNLELALRVAPDPDPDDTGAPQVLTGERAVTTMRAFTLGLP
jgi:mxaK protein